MYKDPKNLERFAFAIQFVIFLCVSHLKTIQTTLKDPNAPTDEKDDDADSNMWTQEETERMLQFVAKVNNMESYLIFTLISWGWFK